MTKVGLRQRLNRLRAKFFPLISDDVFSTVNNNTVKKQSKSTVNALSDLLEPPSTIQPTACRGLQSII